MRKAGEVTYGAAHDGEVGKNRGIVCFERKKDAERAVDDLDGRELNGRTVSYHNKRPISKWLILERKFFPFRPKPISRYRPFSFFDQPKYEILAQN